MLNETDRIEKATADVGTLRLASYLGQPGCCEDSCCKHHRDRMGVRECEGSTYRGADGCTCCCDRRSERPTHVVANLPRLTTIPSAKVTLVIVNETDISRTARAGHIRANITYQRAIKMWRLWEEPSIGNPGGDVLCLRTNLIVS